MCSDIRVFCNSNMCLSCVADFKGVIFRYNVAFKGKNHEIINLYHIKNK